MNHALREVVARKPAFGSVSTDRDGSVYVSVGDTVLRLPVADHWTLMELLSDAAVCLAHPDRRRARQP